MCLTAFNLEITCLAKCSRACGMQIVVALTVTSKTTAELDRPFGKQPDGNLIAFPAAESNGVPMDD